MIAIPSACGGRRSKNIFENENDCPYWQLYGTGL
jgi:hypothetical protein